MNSHANHPFVVWGSCLLWLTSIFAVGWSLLLFICVNDILMLTGTDIINAIVLLSGLVTLPTNIHILRAIANGKKIDYKSKVFCCPLWFCIVCIIMINSIGLVLCAHKIVVCKTTTHAKLNNTIKHYKTVPRYKHFVDNLQWSLQCCGLDSYRDWFDNDWYDTVRDYEWDTPSKSSLSDTVVTVKPLADSVPLSCCKSGSCIANYLLELGTGSINTRGCGDMLTDIILTFMIIYLVMFLFVIIVEVVLLMVLISNKDQTLVDIPKVTREPCTGEEIHLRNILSIKKNFRASSASLHMMPEEDSDEFEKIVRRPESSRLCPRNARIN